MRKKVDLSDYEHGKVVDAGWADMSISQTADMHEQPSLGFTGNGQKKRKCPVSSSLEF